MSWTAETIELPEVPYMRARIVVDEYPHAPEFEAGYPVIRLEYRGYTTRTDGHVYGQEVDGMEDALDHFLTTTDDGLETFARYLRIFHGGDAEVMSRPTSRESGYVVYGTRSLLESWGCGPDQAVVPEADEWEAYIAGDVYGIVIEKHTTTETVTFDTDGTELDFEAGMSWTEIESVWGFYDGNLYYGQSHTIAEATAMLRAYGTSEVAA